MTWAKNIFNFPIQKTISRRVVRIHLCGVWTSGWVNTEQAINSGSFDTAAIDDGKNMVSLCLHLSTLFQRKIIINDIWYLSKATDKQRTGLYLMPQ